MREPAALPARWTRKPPVRPSGRRRQTPARPTSQRCRRPARARRAPFSSIPPDDLKNLAVGRGTQFGAGRDPCCRAKVANCVKNAAMQEWIAVIQKRSRQGRRRGGAVRRGIAALAGLAALCTAAAAGATVPLPPQGVQSNDGFAASYAAAGVSSVAATEQRVSCYAPEVA